MNREEFLETKVDKLLRRYIRRAMDYTGWNAYEAFVNLNEICDKQGIDFEQAANNKLLREYKKQKALELGAYIEEGREIEEYSIDIEKELFEKYFYTKKQKAVRAKMREGLLTMNSLRDYMRFALPEELEDDEENILGSICLVPRQIRTGDIFICVAKKYFRPDIVMQTKPRCVIGYPKQKEAFEEVLGEDVPFITCRNIGSYILDIAEVFRERFKAKSIAVTGSIGKTSTTDMIGLVTGIDREMYKIKGNQNTTWQIFDIVQRLKESTDVYLQECSGSFLSQLEKSSRILVPDIFVETNIQNGHIGNYDNIQYFLMYEKLAIDRHGSENAVGVVNWDDPLLNNVKYHHKVVGYSVKDPSADYFADNIVEANGQILFDIVEKDGRRTPTVLNVCGVHNVLNAAAAFAVGIQLGVSRENIVKAIAAFKTHGIRQNLVWIDGRHLYLDCYSATEGSMRTAVSTMRTIDVPEGGRKIAVLADIPDQGDQWEETHTRVGEMVVEENTADVVFLLGDQMKAAAKVIEAAGIECRHTSDRKQIVEWVKNDTNEKDLIVFKSPHRMPIHWAVDDIVGTDFYHNDEITANEPRVTSGNYKFKLIEGYGAIVVNVETLEKDAVIPAEESGLNVRILDRNLFERTDIESIVIPENVQCLSNSVFNSCTCLKKVALPSTLRFIGRYAFCNCTSLEELKIPEGLGTIDENAFDGCTGLKVLELPASLKTINDTAFEGCDALTIKCPAGSYTEKWAREKGIKVETI